MMQDMEQAIRERAYHLWLEDGRRDGTADAHWLAAQREVLGQSLSTFARVTAEPAKPSKAKKTPRGEKKRRAA